MRSRDVIDDWHRDQAAIEAMLQQKHYAEARKASIKLTNRMFDRLGTDDAVDQAAGADGRVARSGRGWPRKC